MRINEVSEKCNITKRAIKYYEEKHLIKIKKMKMVIVVIQQTMLNV